MAAKIRNVGKIPFNSRIGFREVLVFNLQTWALELYQHQGGDC
jgi:hypothetical protein